MLFDLFDVPFYGTEKHRYSFVYEHDGKIVKSKTFGSRVDANQMMYSIKESRGLQLEKKWDDHHDKTYIMSNGDRFYINRI